MPEETAEIVELEQTTRRGELRRAATEFEENARAEATRRAYTQDFSAFQTWCEEVGRQAMPADSETIVAYLAHLGRRAQRGELKASTIARRLAGLRHAHRQAGEADPTEADQVGEVWRGIRRDDDVVVAPDKALALLREDIRALIGVCDPEETKGLRDRALILVGWFGFLRRGELVGLEVVDVAFHQGGAYLRIRQSKTDQAGEGQLAWLPVNDETPAMCPIGALREWLALLEEGGGPLFRSVGRWGHLREGALSGRTISRVLKRRAEKAGFEQEAIAQISGHSLRRGAAVQADAAGATVAEIQAAGRWQSPTMPFEYAKRGNLKRSSASNMLTT